MTGRPADVTLGTDQLGVLLDDQVRSEDRVEVLDGTRCASMGITAATAPVVGSSGEADTQSCRAVGPGGGVH